MATTIKTPRSRSPLFQLTPPGGAARFDNNKWYAPKPGTQELIEVPSTTPGAISGVELNKLLDKAQQQIQGQNPGAGGGVGGLTGIGGIGDTFSTIADAIGSVLDFLKLIAWLFAPKNLLRAVEFLTGIVLMIFGLWAAIQARGERIEGFTTSESAISRSGLGRVSRELAARAPRDGRQRRIRPRSAPHTVRRDALRVRYQREQDVARRRDQARRGLPSP